MELGRQENRNCVLFIIILKASITPERELAFKHLIKYYKEEEGRQERKRELWQDLPIQGQLHYAT